MTKTEQRQLDELIQIAEERDSPLNDWEQEFVVSLDGKRDRDLSEKQGEAFDRLVRKHLKGD